MSSDQIVIDVQNLSKFYAIYETPRDRLKQLLMPFLFRLCERLVRLFNRDFNLHPPQYFREFWALRDVCFQIKRGETFGVVGRNGSGKSTLLQLICGTLSPTRGDVVAKGRISALLELGSGFNPEYTGKQNVFLNGQILGLTQAEIEARYEKIIQFAEIGDFIDQPIKTYSSGMVVRLAFAVAINVDPEILVIDEALAVGDVGFQARCYAEINKLKQQGVTLLLVSHSPGTITQLCDRAMLLEKGELVLVGQPYQAIRAYNYLANTGMEKLANVREAVVALAKAEDSEKMKDQNVLSVANENTSKENKINRSIAAYYDPQLEILFKPLQFDQQGGEIVDVFITDPRGKKVNILPLHQEVALCFNVRFDRSVKNVRFSWVIRSVNGLVIGGGATHHPGDGVHMSEGAMVFVKSHFINNFLPGDYLIDIGVRGVLEIENEFIHGISNAVSIRSVNYNNKNYRNGLVDCLVEPYFSLTVKAENQVD